jgi:hypothetical protein
MFLGSRPRRHVLPAGAEFVSISAFVHRWRNRPPRTACPSQGFLKLRLLPLQNISEFSFKIERIWMKFAGRPLSHFGQCGSLEVFYIASHWCLQRIFYDSCIARQLKTSQTILTAEPRFFHRDEWCRKERCSFCKAANVSVGKSYRPQDEMETFVRTKAITSFFAVRKTYFID